jgi:branched-chain amino acid transport system substrate-binding protein
VRTALRGLSVDTFYGPIAFDDRGVNTEKPMGTIQVQGGEIKVIAPDGAAVSELVYGG